MPQTESAKKRLRQDLVRRARNRSARSVLKSAVRKVRDAVAAGDATSGQTHFRVAAKKLDQAVAKGVIHKNVAARTKSRLSAALKNAAKARAGAG